MSAAVEAVRGAADALQGLAEDQDADLAGLRSALLQQCCSSVPADSNPCWDALSVMASAFAETQPKVLSTWLIHGGTCLSAAPATASSRSSAVHGTDYSHALMLPLEVFAVCMLMPDVQTQLPAHHHAAMS